MDDDNEDHLHLALRVLHRSLGKGQQISVSMFLGTSVFEWCQP